MTEEEESNRRKIHVNTRTGEALAKVGMSGVLRSQTLLLWHTQNLEFRLQKLWKEFLQREKKC